ncbi:MAG TPA: nucleotidyltransferase [Thermoanaerobaculia bacterium]|nr:nucleotidyltransferase [Thermoanaerobaculia bacterium]
MRSRDYEEFVASLNERGAKYLIVGAHAVAFHARPRATKDLDLFLDPSLDNAGRVLAAIRSFLGSDLGLTVEDLSTPGQIVQLGVAPTRIDLLCKLVGIPEFQAAWDSRTDAKFGDVDAHYLSLDDLIREKESAGRDQDRADLRSLRSARAKRL